MDLNEENYEKRSQRKKGSGFGYFFAALGGAIVGALVLLFLFPEIGIIDGNESTNTSQSEATGNQCDTAKCCP